MWYYSPTKKTSQYIKLEQELMICGFLVNMENTIAIYSYSTPWALIHKKWCVAPDFFFISPHCSSQIWFAPTLDYYNLSCPILCVGIKVEYYTTTLNFRGTTIKNNKYKIFLEKTKDIFYI